VLRPVLDRIHLESLGSPAFYRAEARRLGWQEVGFTDLTEHLVRHYGRVREELEARRGELRSVVSDGYITRMIQGLGHWVDAGRKRHPAWGILPFRNPAGGRSTAPPCSPTSPTRHPAVLAGWRVSCRIRAPFSPVPLRP